MIAEPPLSGATHSITTLVPEIVVVGAALTAVGTVAGSTAPLPWKDAAEVPTAFLAVTRA